MVGGATINTYDELKKFGPNINELVLPKYSIEDNLEEIMESE